MLGVSIKSKAIYLMLRSDILVLDDPTSALDQIVSSKIMRDIHKNLLLKEKTFVITTTDPKMLKYADRVIYMKNGQIIFFDSVDVLRESNQVIYNLIKQPTDPESNRTSPSVI